MWPTISSRRLDLVSIVFLVDAAMALMKGRGHADQRRISAFFYLGAPFGFVEKGEDVGGLVQGFHDGLVSEQED